MVQQNRDSDFARLRKKVQEGQQTNNDVIQIKGLANTDTSTWLDEFLKVYLNKYLAGQENEACIGKLDFEVNVIKVKSSNKDIDTNACSISIPDSIRLSQTAKLLAKLKLCVGARLGLTDNISVSDRSINSSFGTVNHLYRLNPLCSAMYVKFDDP